MASKKKIEKIEPVIIEEHDIIPEEIAKDLKPEEIIEVETPKVIIKKEEKVKKPVKSEKIPKYSIGSIVFISKNAEADLNGFKLFPPYKKYTYTVEAYDAISEVYFLRRLNLLLKLKEADIVAPSERAHDSINRRQF